ncbi:MAG: adenosylcobinamide-GDP ribazoletransferase [Aliidongia sp.]
MRDSRVGSYGVLALVIGVGLRVFSAFGAAGRRAGDGAGRHGRRRMPSSRRRSGRRSCMASTRARPGGLGAGAGRPAAPIAQAAAGIGVAIVLATLGCGGEFSPWRAAAAAMAATATLARRQIGGYTGDVLGAAQQVAEAAVLARCCGRSLRFSARAIGKEFECPAKSAASDAPPADAMVVGSARPGRGQ